MTSRSGSSPANDATYPLAPGHRGVSTSVEAADAIRPHTGRLQRLALDAVKAAGPRGLTADETVAALGLNRWSVQPRLSELRKLGLICDGGARRPNATGRSAICWVAVTGHDEAAQLSQPGGSLAA